MTDTPATKLAMVNDIMRRVGKLPVGALDTNGGSAQAHVERSLEDAIDTVLSKGWYFNRKFDVTMTADSSDEMPLSLLTPDHTNGIYHIDSFNNDAWRNITVRDSKLYDLDDNTATFTEDSEILVEYTYRVDVQDMPESFKNWVIAQAAFNFNRHYIGNAARDGQLQAEIANAEQTSRREEFEAADVNVLDTQEARQLRGRPRMYRQHIRSVFE